MSEVTLYMYVDIKRIYPMRERKRFDTAHLRDGPAGGRATHEHVHGSRLVY
jgi:hypothetical protein